jgi:hypothetical protein
MFVKSSMGRDVKYSKSTGAILIKANTVTLIDDNLVTVKELKDCYGDRITIMSQEAVDQLVGELANTGNPEVDAFLNGETEQVPEGTEEIDEAEALRLEAEAKKAEEERLAKEAEEAEKAEEERLAKEAEAKAAEEVKIKAEKAEEDKGEDETPRTLTKKSSAKSKGKTGTKKK